MSFKDATIVDGRGNTNHWECAGCTPRNDQHQPNEYGDPCPYQDKPLMTAKENPNNYGPLRPAYCKPCGCHYSMGCPTHPVSDQTKLAKSS